jgi:hypothetical protein
MEHSEEIARVSRIRELLPPEGLFADKNWLISPEPFTISPEFAALLERLGHWLWKFYRASNLLYCLSKKGKQPAWIAQYLEVGKPAALLELAENYLFDLPKVIRPDLILTDHGFGISELDSVPGGIGLTGWLNQAYASLGFDVLGGASGMVEGFRSILPEGVIAVSRESETYRPEMKWLQRELSRQGEDRWQVVQAEDWNYLSERPVYRFFELFDLKNFPSRKSLFQAARDGSLKITPPLKPFLEEKMWFGLFWSRPLREYWRRQLSERHYLKLLKLIPQTWIVDPSPVPHHAVIPGLEIQSWDELKRFSQRQREFVLKISGFSERAWGSRGVYVGTDLPHHGWAERIDEAKAAFRSSPFILQKFFRGSLFPQKYWNANTGKIETLRGRVRLCPYYFVVPGDRIKLGGALATIVPADKKLVHGMRDGIMVPVAIA